MIAPTHLSRPLTRLERESSPFICLHNHNLNMNIINFICTLLSLDFQAEAIAMSVVKPKVHFRTTSRQEILVKSFFVQMPALLCFCIDIIGYGGGVWQVHNPDLVYLWLRGSAPFHGGAVQVPITNKKVYSI